MKKIMIYAYTRLNLGDDLFVKILCDRYPNIKFKIICPKNYSDAFKNIKNLKCYSFDAFIERSINYILRKFKYNDFLKNYVKNSADVNITIGGSLFMQNEYWKNGIKELYKRCGNNKKSYILGANFGPYTDLEYLKSHENLFNEYTDICLRDKYSYELFKKLKNVRMSPDIVFQLKKEKNTKENKTIVISVIKPSVRKNLVGYDKSYYNKLKEITIKYIELGFNVNLMSFCKDEGDEEAIKYILNSIPNKYLNNIDSYFYRGNMEEALSVIENCKAVIATRFHAMILGFVYDKPVYPIIYSEKMKNVISDISDEIKYIELEKINEINCENIISYLDNTNININDLVKKSENHFLKLDKILRNNS